MKVEPVTLEGRWVRLEPLRVEHVEGLCEVGLDEELWRWTPTRVRTLSEMRVYVETAIEDGARGVSLPFATVERSSGRVIGSTRFASIDARNRRVEIGYTWLAAEWQRTPVNTEAKCLMLHHAFEKWGAIRVELKTDALNEKSRRAILRIGAKEEGTLRKHVITYSGRARDTVYYSIVDSEWPNVKAYLETKLKEKGEAGKG